MTRSTRDRLGRSGFVVSMTCLLSALVLAWVPADAAPGGDHVSRAVATPFTATKTLTRTFVEDDGSTYSFPSNTVTVNASQTEQLRGRQRIQISWTGAQPSGGRASNPYGENGLQQEYPVLILQCRGTDDASLPLDQQVRPETCWTNSVAQRSQIARSAGDAIWTKDVAAPPADTERLSGATPFPDKTTCPKADQDTYYTHLTPFVAANGTVYSACDSEHMPPEAAVGAAFPPAELAAFSDLDGNGSVQFEVRSDVENESLGCNDEVACSIVVIPINGLSCAQSSTPASVADTTCRKGGQFEAGSSNFVNGGVDAAASPALWWSASNWANRISIPITFGLPPDTCDVLDPRAPTGFYGSELMAQAALQWAPAYCLDKKRFKFQLNQMSDAAGWNLMQNGGGAAAFVSSAHKRTNDDPVGLAPTAVTGFAIGYNIDKPDNQGEFDDLRLTPRLVAKLLTQSYLGSDLGRGHPGIGSNPLGLMNDPEFQELNPGLSQISQEAGASLMSLSTDSDVVEQLTEWIAEDGDAMAFVAGKPDPWGMVVNPAYKKLKLPRSEWPLLDDYVPTTNNTCRQNNPQVYFTQLAAPVTLLRKVSDALLDGWPNVQTRCDFDQSTQSYKLGRVDRQSYGARFLLGVVSLGDAARYGLRTAALQTAKGTFVAPDEASLSAAVELMAPKEPGKGKGGQGGQGGTGGNGSQGNGGAGERLAAPSASASPSASPTADPSAGTTETATGTGPVPVDPNAEKYKLLGQPFELDQADVRKAGDAYPGTMVVYTAARLRELPKSDAAKVALFIRTATTEGQKEGAGNGELPAGFLPLSKQGVTAKLYRRAQTVADAVAAQTPAPTAGPAPTQAAEPSSGAAPSLPDPTLPDLSVPIDDGAATEAAVPAAAAPTTSAAAEPVAMPATQAVSSDLGHRALPVLLVIGLIGMAVTSVLRFFVRPPSGGLR